MTQEIPVWANLGCGKDYREKWHNVDYRDGIRVDESWDLNDMPWPWADDTFDVVLMDNVIEHLDDRLAALQEIHRVVKLGETAILRFPHWNSSGHYGDPTHTKTLTHKTFRHNLVLDLFEVVDVSCTRVRFGRALPEQIALWFADHVGQIVSEVEVTLRVS